MTNVTGTDTDDRLATLKEDATYFQPDLFAIYGVTEAGHPYISWGFRFDDRVLFHDPIARDTWIGATVEEVLARQQELGDAGLVRLD